MPITKAQLEAQNATLAAALEKLTLTVPAEAEAPKEPSKAKAKPAKVRSLAACHAVPGTKFGFTPEPRTSGRHYVSVISLHADGSPVMSSTTNAPRKPARVPVQVAEYLLTDEGQAALREQVDSLA